jgi:hypothetical protein
MAQMMPGRSGRSSRMGASLERASLSDCRSIRPPFSVRDASGYSYMGIKFPARDADIRIAGITRLQPLRCTYAAERTPPIEDGELLLLLALPPEACRYRWCLRKSWRACPLGLDPRAVPSSRRGSALFGGPREFGSAKARSADSRSNASITSFLSLLSPFFQQASQLAPQ